ncbi:MAG TPA: hypothetical protein PK122_05805 [Candidatus Paceibacterota bacterium]|nr:hypothetical protein [Candidatus Paceibacterota bacterium]
MYSDNKKIFITPLDDKGVREFMNIFHMNKYLIIGHTPDFFRRVDDPAVGKTFDQLFYEDTKIPFEYKWEKFHYERDLKREREVYYDILGLSDKSEFIFIHEGNYKPISKELPKDMSVIKPDNKDVGIFDYLYTIERAYQIHVGNSSFMNLIDCIRLRNDNIFYHEYSRPGINTVLKLPWKILK